MYLQELNIKKFRAVENMNFVFDEEKPVNAFGGINGIGKTTVIDSVLWVLADETLVCGGENSKNLDDNNEKEPLEVELVFKKSDGNTLKLKRVYYATYRKDGSFNKYNNEFYIDDTPYSVTDYFTRLSNEIGLNDLDVKGFNTMRALIDFNYFGTIDYKIARKKIEVILKLENDNDILNQEKYNPIARELQSALYDVAKCKTLFNKQKTIAENDVERKIETIETLSKNNKPVDKKALESLKEKLAEIQKKEFTHSIEYLNAKELSKKYSDRVNETYNNLAQIKKEYDMAEIKKNNVLNGIESKKKELEDIKVKFNNTKNSVRKCPNCNYELNGDVVKQQLIEIGTIGKKLQAELKQIDTTAIENNYKEALDKIQEADKLHKQALKEQQDFIQSQAELRDREDSLAKTFYDEKQNAIAEFTSQINEIESQNNDSVIAKLKEELVTDRDVLAKTELKIELLAEFEKEKITAIQNKAEQVFPGIEFKLLEYSNTGAEIKTCKATYKNVDYARLNDAQKIKLGIEIIEDLRKALGVTESLPIIFDKFRDLDNDNIKNLKVITDSQVLTTYVSKDTNITIFNY